jgi:hypothetical protein
MKIEKMLYELTEDQIETIYMALKTDNKELVNNINKPNYSSYVRFWIHELWKIEKTAKALNLPTD